MARSQNTEAGAKKTTARSVVWPRFAFLLGLATVFAPLQARAIVGAAEADPALQRRLVMLLIRDGGKSGFCTAIVLSPCVVLTAAHCIKPLADMRIFYRDAGGAQVVDEVAASIVHPGYRADAIARRIPSIDLALVKTAKPLTGDFSSFDLQTSVTPVVGDPVRIAGFGVAREGDQKSAGVARSAMLVVREPLSKILLWADDPTRAGSGACLGDSGGAVYSQTGALIATIAWAGGAGRGHCGGLTQSILLAPQTDWIRSARDAWAK